MTPLPEFNPLTASARVLKPIRRLTPTYTTWQEEVWDYFDRLGEFESGVDWLAKTMSRVRLLAAEVSPGGDEPQVIESGPAAEAIERLAGGTAGQAQLTKEFTLHLSVPGEGWLLGEAPEGSAGGLTGEETWSVKSADELRVSRARIDGQATYEVREGDSSTAWRPVSPNSLVVRVWDPHPRFGWQADSAARHARGSMLKLDLINKRIIATILSRLASNGILLYDKTRLSLPASSDTPEDGQATDPFAQTLVDVAARGIKDPTSPEATIPIPIGFELQGELQNVRPELLLRHITFASEVDDKLVGQRESAIRELATSLDMPAEVMLGLGAVNHWSAWQIEESGLKIHVSPKAELICYSLTTGYMIPTLKAMGANLTGPNGGKIIVWYDPSEVTARPDKSANVVLAYDRLEANGDALRRETGLDDGDKPDPAELRAMILKKQAGMPALSAAAFEEITGKAEVTIQPASEDSAPEDMEDVESETGPPGTKDEAPPAPGEEMPKAASLIEALGGMSVEDLLQFRAAIEERLPQPGPMSTWLPAGEPGLTLNGRRGKLSPAGHETEM